MDGPESADILASDTEREQMRTLLEEACVEGRLTLEDFSERIGQALTARTRGELQVLGRDLPPVPLPASPRSKSVSSTVAVMSSAERVGRWRLEDESVVRVVLGSCKLDLRGATISSQVSTIHIRAIMGSIEVIVPEGVDVELDVSVIASSRRARLIGAPPPPGAPLVRITGAVIASSVTVRDHATLSEQIRDKLKGMME